MADLLHLVRPAPCPAGKCDEVRSRHLLCHPASRQRMFRAIFADDPARTSAMGRAAREAA